MATRTKVLRAPIESGSMSDVILHFLYMYNKTDVYGTPTSCELYEINSARYKKRDNFEKALSRLVSMKLITFYTTSEGKHYFITEKGIDSIYKLAMLRSRKEAASKASAGKRGTDIQYGYGLE